MIPSYLDPSPVIEPEQRARWRVRIDLPIGAVVFEPDAVMAVRELSQSARLDWQNGPRAAMGGTARIHVADDGEAASTLRSVWAMLTHPPALSIERVTTGGDEPFWRGYLDQVNAEGGHLELLGASSLPGRRRRLCRAVEDLFGALPTRVGDWLPVVFGRVPNVPATLITPLRGARLVAPLGAGDGTMRIDDGTDWPESGLVQVGDELLSFTAVDASGRLGTAESPLLRATPRDHRTGTAVWLLPDVQLVSWIAADHPATVAAVRIVGSETEVAPLVSVLAVGELPATVVQLPHLPLAITHGVAPVERSSPRDATLWLPTIENLVWGAQAAFATIPGYSAATLSYYRRLLEVEWQGDLAQSVWRHDRIQRAALVFEFSPKIWWGGLMRLEVTIGRGDWRRIAVFDLYGTMEDLRDVLDTDIAERGPNPEGPDLLLDMQGSLPFHEVEVDLTDVVGEDWAFFSAAGGNLRVSFRFLEPVVGTTIQVRRAGWRLEVLPATSANPSPRIECDLVGLLAEGDELCDPAQVVAHLCGNDRMGSAQMAPTLASDLAVASGVMASRSLRFSSAIRDGSSIADVLSAAAGEAGVLVSETGAGFTLRALPDHPGGGTALAFDPAAVDVRPTAQRLSFRSHPDPIPRRLKSNDPAGAVEGPSQGSLWQAAWIASGESAALAFLTAWFQRARVESERRLSTITVRPVPGESVSFPGEGEPAATALAWRIEKEGLALTLC